MRNMSFSATEQQIRDELKDVTRRLNWAVLQPGDYIQAVDRCMGFKKGEHPVKLKVLRVLSTRWEALNAITQEDCRREGFPHLSPAEFVAMFCKMNRCPPDQWVNRIEFEYVAAPTIPSNRFKLKLKIDRLVIEASSG